MKVSMNMMVVVAWLLAGSARADEPKALAALQAGLQAPGMVLVDDEDASALKSRIAEGSTAESVAVPADPKVPMSKALRLRVARSYPHVYDVELYSSSTQAAVRKGDTVLACVWLRASGASGTANGKVGLRLQQPGSPHASPGGADAVCDHTWKATHVIGVATQDFEARDLQLAVHLGHQSQEIEVGAIVIVNLGAGIDPAKLPHTH